MHRVGANLVDVPAQVSGRREAELGDFPHGSSDRSDLLVDQLVEKSTHRPSPSR
jgi:hypothetical protein